MYIQTSLVVVDGNGEVKIDHDITKNDTVEQGEAPYNDHQFDTKNP